MFGEALPKSRRSGAARSGFGTSSLLRDEVKPPSLRCEPSTGWQRLKFWMLAPAPLESAPPLSELPAVRADFLACLEGLDDAQTRELALRIQRARSLRDLWHLRAPLFGHVAQNLSQSQAQARLQSLRRHFGTRSPRSAFLPLEP